jgi:hypothetical protein
MTLLIAWLVFPIVLGLLSLGCGLLLERSAGTRLPAALRLPAGFVVVSLATEFAHLGGGTAGLGTPVVVSLAAAGFGLSLPRRGERLDRWLAAAGAAVYGVFAAPALLTGRATFLGYIKLDDTANYLALLERATHHGYDTSGLGPSTYEAFLESSYVIGYPLGSLLPLGVGSTLVGRDAIWTWQPYLAFLAALIGLGLYGLVSGLVSARPLRALVAFVGAQAALIYGYALWGGVKELFTAVVVVLVAGLVPPTVGRAELRAMIPLAAACAALAGGLSLGGMAWLAPPLVAAIVLASRRIGVRATARTTCAFAAVTAVLAIPAIAAGSKWISHTGAFTGSSEYGNLLRRLSWLQVFGIWLHGDFRTPPSSLDVTYVLVAVVAFAAAVALLLAWSRRRWELPIALAAAAFACAVYVLGGSPWIGGKALASASPIVLAAALAAAAVAFEGGRRTEGVAISVVVVAGVLWSNALQYHDVFVAPSGRLSELATIGHRFAGRGPTLMTEFEPYGARYLLRNMQTEGASELRRHPVLLRTGGPSPTGTSPDVDEIRLDALQSYRTLVVRRSGVASRPPSDYSLVWAGRYYQVWQRPDRPSPIVEHLSLGNRLQPASVPPCGEVLALARVAAANGGVLATVERPPAIVIEGDGTVGVPTSFGRYGEYPGALRPSAALSVDTTFAAPSAGTYGIWVGGSFRARVQVSVDGRTVGAARDVLQWPANFVEVGRAGLAAGRHAFRLEYGGPDLRPGSAGLPPFGLGPFAVAEGTQDRPVTTVEPADARSLCGRSLDWIEALRG